MQKKKVEIQNLMPIFHVFFSIMAILALHSPFHPFMNLSTALPPNIQSISTIRSFHHVQALSVRRFFSCTCRLRRHSKVTPLTPDSRPQLLRLVLTLSRSSWTSWQCMPQIKRPCLSFCISAALFLLRALAAHFNKAVAVISECSHSLCARLTWTPCTCPGFKARLKNRYYRVWMSSNDFWPFQPPVLLHLQVFGLFIYLF